MPPQPPEGKKKKKGRAPKHQNSFAFRHNPGSKLTDKILNSPNVGVCRRCHDKIEWRKKYRKYKPRSQPGKCNQCNQKNVMAAYHTICSKCTGSDAVIAAMEAKRPGIGGGSSTSTTAATANGERGDPESICAELVPENETAEEEEEENNATTSTTTAAAAVTRRTAGIGRIRACAVCTAEPALSKYAHASPQDMDVIDRISELEESLETGMHYKDGHRLTVREKKSVERKIDKLRGEMKDRSSKNKEESEDEGGGEDEGGESEQGDGNDSEDEDSVEEPEASAGGFEEEVDPFLAATGGKALVGDDYQKMLLAKEQQK